MKKKIIALIIIFVIAESVLLITVRHFENSLINQHMSENIDSVSQSYQNSIISAKDVSDIIFRLMIDNNRTLSIFARASNADEATRNTIRKQLYDHLKNLYNQQRNIGLKQIHFHLKDSTSFLRMYEPEIFGDSLRGVRGTVDFANRYKKFAEGFEEGHVANGFRFVYPLFYKGAHIGSVETCISASKIALAMNSFEPGMHDFIVRKSVITSSLFPPQQENYSASGISDGYLREINSFDYLDKKNKVFSGAEEYFNALTKMKPMAEDRLRQGKPFALHICLNNKEITSTFMPVLNPSHKQIGYFIDTRIDDRYSRIVSICQAVIIIGSGALFLICCIIYLVIINVSKTKSLNTALDEKLHEHEEQLKFKEEILFQQSKLATLGEMFASLAHQWKQPLNILGMYIQNLVEEEEELSEEEYAKRELIVNKCMAQINYMSETINDFMDFIRPSDTADMRMDVIRTAEEVVKLLKPSMDKKKIEISVNYETDMRLKAKASSNEMKHILVNIINNAKDAILDVKKTDKTFIGHIDISFMKKDGNCVIKIADNGGGIGSGIIEKVFMPYFSTKEKKEGSGLGLYMCRTIVKKYNGTLDVHNEHNGAVFTITIPVAETPDNVK